MECLGCGKEVNGKGIQLKGLACKTDSGVVLNLFFNKRKVCNVTCASQAIEEMLVLKIADLVTKGKTSGCIAKLAC